MVQATTGRIVKTYRSEGFMVIYVDSHGREYPMRQAPIKRVWLRNKTSVLSAVEKACESFLIEEEFNIPDRDLPFSAIKIVYYQRELGKPKVNESLVIRLGGVDKIRIEHGCFSVTIENAHKPKIVPSMLKVSILTETKKTKSNLLIRR